MVIADDCYVSYIDGITGLRLFPKEDHQIYWYKTRTYLICLIMLVRVPRFFANTLSWYWLVYSEHATRLLQIILNLIKLNCFFSIDHGYRQTVVSQSRDSGYILI